MTHIVVLRCYTAFEIKRREMLTMMYLNGIAEDKKMTMEVLLI